MKRRCGLHPARRPYVDTPDSQTGIFLSANMSRLALGPSQAPIQLVPGDLFCEGKAVKSMKMITCRLRCRLRMLGVMPPFH
jgi:hypothetical protein